MTDNAKDSIRDIVFISKATPGDDEFVLWLAPRLEAAGYKVFADIKTLEAGDRWRKEITNTLHDRAVKMLLCCRDSTLARDGVQEEIGIALDLTKKLLFSPIGAEEAGVPYDDARKQHRLRRSVCKGWRNKQWHGRLMAFIEILSRDLSHIALPLSASTRFTLEAAPLLFSSPVSTKLPNTLEDDEEEVDETTLGRPDPEEEP